MNKLQSNTVAGRLFNCMTAETRTDDRGSATELELYLPAGVTPSSETSCLERLWGYLFNHGVEPPK